MEQLDKQQVSISLSHGAALPNSVLPTANLAELLNRAASRSTELLFAIQLSKKILDTFYLIVIYC